MLRPAARLGLGLAAAVLVVDQATKWAVVDWLQQLGAQVPVTSFFNMVYVLNRGASFGLFSSDSPWGPWLLSAFGLAVASGLAVWLWRTDDRLLGAALGLIIGGALGNLWDRLARGAVVDFLDFHVAGWHWPAFNVADSAITVGAAMIILGSLIGNPSGRRLGDNQDS